MSWKFCNLHKIKPELIPLVKVIKYRISLFKSNFYLPYLILDVLSWQMFPEFQIFFWDIHIYSSELASHLLQYHSKKSKYKVLK